MGCFECDAKTREFIHEWKGPVVKDEQGGKHCYIDNLCFGEGDPMPSGSTRTPDSTCLFCDPDQITFAWSPKSGTAPSFEDACHIDVTDPEKPCDLQKTSSTNFANCQKAEGPGPTPMSQAEQDRATYFGWKYCANMVRVARRLATKVGAYAFPSLAHGDNDDDV